MNQWSTTGLPAKAQFDFWREVISKSFVPLRPERIVGKNSTSTPHNQSFSCSLASWEANDLFFGRVCGQEQWVFRGEQEIAEKDRPVYFLNIQHQGHAIMRQGERESLLTPHSFALVDASRPFEMYVSDDFEQLSIKIPKARLAHLLADVACSPPRGIACASGLGRIVVNAFETIREESSQLDPMSSELAIEHAMAITAFALNQSKDPAPKANRSQRLLAHAKSYLVAHLNDPELGTQQLAEDLGLSVRYIQTLFAASQTSVGQWILDQRLQQCRQDLLANSNSEDRIATIAFRRGFNDLSYFNRSFKRRFGMTPSQSRNQ
jgi:AraC family transcriptional regulator, positive regulator of tynA and feaB